jgi:tripartite-type tricarboxylate transporter receptor subunit TctC
LGVFDSERLTWAPGWGEIPTVKEALGLDIQYLMLRGIFGPPGMPKDAVEWYLGLLKKVSDTKQFKDYLMNNALKAAWQTGPDYVKWLDGAEKLHKDLMEKGGLLKK